MKPGAILLIGLRNLGGRSGKEGGSRHLAGAVLGIALSLIPLYIVLEVSDGMIEGITARYIEVGTYHLQAIFYRELPADEIERLAGEIAGLPEVTAAFPERQGLGLITASRNRSGTTIRAVPENLFETDPGMREYLNIVEGSFDLSSPRNILLGRGVARELGVGPGDQVRIVTARSAPGKAFIPRIDPFTVTGIVSSGYEELDALWSFVPYSRGESMLAPASSQQIIGIKVADPFGPLGPVAARIRTYLPDDARLATWYDLEKAQYKSFQTTRALLLFIMALIVAVAAVNISSSLVMLVIERRQEIAIMKSIGGSPGGITLSFLFTGFLVGVAGTFLGTCLGLFAAVNINELILFLEWAVNSGAELLLRLANPFAPPTATDIRIFNPAFYLERIPIRVNMLEVALVAGFTVAVSLLAAYFPARSAGRIRPLEVLRKH